MTTNVLPLLTQRAFNRPLFVHPSLGDQLYAVMNGRINVAAFGVEASGAPQANQFVGSNRREDGSRRLTRAAGKTGIITIDGSLVNRGAWTGANVCTGLVSYEGIGAQADEAAADPGIEHVILDLNTYGGEANGMATAAAKLRNLAKKKHVIAIINDVAASAGYGLASAADEIVVSPTSVVGSIGVVMLHLDRSLEMAAQGIRPTLIHAGAHKVDGNPFGPLPESVRTEMQRDVMAFYDQFLSVVEAGRGKSRLSVKKARDTEARTFIGQDAITAGLADRIGTFDEVLAELSRPKSRATPNSPKGSKAMMPENNDQNPAPEATLSAASIAALASAVGGAVTGAFEAFGFQKPASAQAPAAPSAPQSAADAVAADRARVAAIMALPEAKGRETVAAQLASNGMSADAAKAVLAAVPAAAFTPPPDQREPGREIGASGQPVNASAEQVKAGWSNAFKRLPSQR